MGKSRGRLFQQTIYIDWWRIQLLLSPYGDLHVFSQKVSTYEGRSESLWKKLINDSGQHKANRGKLLIFLCSGCFPLMDSTIQINDFQIWMQLMKLCLCNCVHTHSCRMEDAVKSQRAIIFFLWKEGACTNEIVRRLFNVFGEKAVSQSTVYNWINHFWSWRQSLNDEPRTGRPAITITRENISNVEKHLLENRCITMSELAEITEIPQHVSMR